MNTVLHVQMGLVGSLIVDPNPPTDAQGRKWAFRDGPVYDIERLWALGFLDPRWHDLNHHAGVCGEDVGLNYLNPDWLLINGIVHPRTVNAASVAVNAKAGQTILIRAVNNTYYPERLTFGGLEAEVIAADGRPFRAADGTPVSFTAKSLRIAAAERYDCLLRPKVPGVYTATAESLHWVTGEPIADKLGARAAKTTISIT